MPGDVGVPLRIDGDAVGQIVAAAAEIRGVGQDRIDQQRAAAIVRPDFKSDLVLAEQDEVPSDPLALPLGEHGLAEFNLPVAEIEEQIALRIETQPARSFERQADAARIGARGHREVKLELPSAAVEDQVHAWIDVLVLHASKGGNVGAPLRWIVADQIIRLARHFVAADGARIRMAADGRHPNGSIAKLQGSFAVPQNKSVAGAARKELRSMSFKGERQPSIARRDLRGTRRRKEQKGECVPDGHRPISILYTQGRLHRL